MIFGISTLSSAEADLDNDRIKAGNAKLIGGGRGGVNCWGGGGVKTVAISKWWNVMKWLAFIEMILLTAGINFMFLALIYSIMIKYPSRYMRDRCSDYGYEMYGSAVGKVVTENDPRYPNWTENLYTDSIAELDGRVRHCDVYVHANFNPDGSFAHHDDKGGLFSHMLDGGASEGDPAIDWWGWAFVGLLPLVLATLLVSGYAAKRAQKAARVSDEEDDKKKKWVKVLVDVGLEAGQENGPMFYPKNNFRGAHRWVPRQLQANEVFLLLGKANDDLLEVLTVPWDPSKGYTSKSNGARFSWPWAHLYAVHEIAEMFKATKRIHLQKKSIYSVMGGPSNLEDGAQNSEDLTSARFDVDALLKTFDCMHATGDGGVSPEEKAAAKGFFETFADQLDKNGDKILHLPELLGPLGALDIDMEMLLTDKTDKDGIDTSHPRPGSRHGRARESFGTYATNTAFKADFDPEELRFKGLYFKPHASGGDEKNAVDISLWEIMEREFPHVNFQTLLRLNCLERGYIKQGFVGPPVEGTSASNAFRDDFDVNEYYVGTEDAMRQTKRHDVENSVAFVANIKNNEAKSEKTTVRQRSSIKKQRVYPNDVP
jgi:hypothetical protein